MLDNLNEAFPHSRPATRDSLALAADLRTYAADDLIIRQGDSSSVALVLEGHVGVRRTTEDGREFMVRIVTRGRVSPVLPLAAIPASADAVALTPSVALVWRSEFVRSLATADPGFAVDLLDDVLESLDRVIQRADGLFYQGAIGRVARALEQNASLFFGEPPILTRSHLPSLVGTSREMTGRVLRALEARNLVVRVGRDRLRLLDPAGLAEVAVSGLDGIGRTSTENTASGSRHGLRSARTAS
jgi:CRP-like cAMP-binding protein